MFFDENHLIDVDKDGRDTAIGMAEIKRLKLGHDVLSITITAIEGNTLHPSKASIDYATLLRRRSF